MTVLGHWLTLCALVAAAGSALAYARAAGRRQPTPNLPRRLLIASVLLVLSASAILLVLLLRHDFTNAYVFSYSDRSLPLFYLLSSFYAGQEGSFLFWAACSSVLSVMLLRFTSRRSIEPWVMTAYMGIQTILLLLVTFKSPFRMLWEVFEGASPLTVPADGRGLNPLLQNFWMVIHPPVLFLGFASMAVPFSFAVAALWTKTYDLLAQRLLPWLIFSVAVLGLGIMLGAYWAYGVLGWGGYWGWDPVENSSLIPWLVAVALLHTLLAERRTGKYRRTNMVLSVGSFFFVVYSTFLTRSGILGDASVHSFTDPGTLVYGMLLAFLAVIGLAGGVLIVLRWRALQSKSADRAMLTRETWLGAGALVLILSAVVILVGTSLPIFSTTRVEASWYDTTNLPIAIAMGLLVGFSLLVQWESGDALSTLRRSWRSLVAALVLTVVVIVMGVRDTGMIMFAFASLFAFAVNMEVGVQVARGDPRFLGGKIAHIGLALFFLGVISTGRYSEMKQVVLPLNMPKEALGHTLVYTGAAELPDGKYAYTVEMEKDGEKFSLAPVMFEAGAQGVMRNPDIKSFLTRDIYLSPVALEAGGRRPETSTLKVAKGERAGVKGATVTFLRFDMGQHGSQVADAGMVVGAVLEVERGAQKETVVPVITYRPNASPEYRDAQSALLGGPLRLVSMSVGMGDGVSAVTLGLPGSAPAEVETLIVEASVKPLVNLLWGGTVLMMVGFFLAILKRAKES